MKVLYIPTNIASQMSVTVRLLIKIGVGAGIVSDQVIIDEFGLAALEKKLVKDAPGRNRIGVFCRKQVEKYHDSTTTVGQLAAISRREQKLTA